MAQKITVELYENWGKFTLVIPTQEKEVTQNPIEKILKEETNPIVGITPTKEITGQKIEDP